MFLSNLLIGFESHSLLGPGCWNFWMSHFCTGCFGNNVAKPILPGECPWPHPHRDPKVHEHSTCEMAWASWVMPECDWEKTPSNKLSKGETRPQEVLLGHPSLEKGHISWFKHLEFSGDIGSSIQKAVEGQRAKRGGSRAIPRTRAAEEKCLGPKGGRKVVGASFCLSSIPKGACDRASVPPVTSWPWKGLKTPRSFSIPGRYPRRKVPRSDTLPSWVLALSQSLPYQTHAIINPQCLQAVFKYFV